MKKSLLIIAMLVSSLTYAHTATEAEKREVYQSILTQLEKGNITKEVAQKQWLAYVRCCRDI